MAGDLGGVFDATQVAPSTPRNFDPLPKRDFVMHIIESEVKPYKDANISGRRLELTFEVLEEGEFKGRRLWTGLNIQHPNAQTQEIAQKDFSAICHATNRLRPSDSSELRFIPLVVSVGIKSKKGEDPQNVPRGYKRLEAGSAATATAPTPSSTAARTTAAPATPPVAPWHRKAS